MVEIYEGKLGGGKTYFAVERMIEALAQGRHVFTNIDLNPDGVDIALTKRFGKRLNSDLLHRLKPDQIPKWNYHIHFGVFGHHTLVVIDEAHLFFNSRDWGKTHKENPEMLSFLTQSRKACVDIVFITQHSGNLDSQFRRMALFIWVTRNLVDTKVFLLSDILRGCVIRSRKDYTGEVLGTEVRKLKKDIFNAYDTSSMLDPEMIAFRDGATIAEKLPVNRASLWRKFICNFK